jgi:hypothetical protein
MLASRSEASSATSPARDNERVNVRENVDRPKGESNDEYGELKHGRPRQNCP